MVYDTILLMDILLYCWTGNNIIYKVFENIFSDLIQYIFKEIYLFQSDMLTFNACNADWYFWSKEKRKDFSIFLNSLHEPIQLNTGSIFPMSLSTFTSVREKSILIFLYLFLYNFYSCFRLLELRGVTVLHYDQEIKGK